MIRSRLNCPCGDGTRPGHPAEWCDYYAERTPSPDAPRSEPEFFDEDAAIMSCGHAGRFWSSEWRRCFVCAGVVPSDGDEGERDTDDALGCILIEYAEAYAAGAWPDWGVYVDRLRAALRSPSPNLEGMREREIERAALEVCDAWAGAFEASGFRIPNRFAATERGCDDRCAWCRDAANGNTGRPGVRKHLAAIRLRRALAPAPSEPKEES